MRSKSNTLLSVLVAGIVFASGCATSNGGFSSFSQSKLESVKKPEVVLVEASQQQFIDALTMRMVSDGWELESTENAKAVYRVSGRNAIGFLTKIASEVEERSAYRMTCTFSNVQEGVRVIGKLEICEVPGAESPTFVELINWDARAKVQKILDNAKSFAPSFPISQVTTSE